MELPVRHGEGKFYSDESVIRRLAENKQIAVRYALPDGAPAGQRFPFNPNGSVGDIAGICDPTGRIFGLMPHPEAFNHWTNHPDWTRLKEERKRKGERQAEEPPSGLRVFQNAVKYMAG
jgi:phosphoribosylformylglycinamidine synthase